MEEEEGAALGWDRQGDAVPGPRPRVEKCQAGLHQGLESEDDHHDAVYLSVGLFCGHLTHLPRMRRMLTALNYRALVTGKVLCQAGWQQASRCISWVLGLLIYTGVRSSTSLTDVL